eukprot:TRINITY_DN615_c5_g1_i1.p1 TRINITY_DN615_c5_g1~~TRINITY_DN615_c5_g1_i1.p1  ORF type:complete len:388 (+),score=88.05 TRINITY_DN615_c5_g1_i1:54-1217(+)
MATPGPPNETSPAWDEFLDCGCPEVIDHFVVLFPYYWLLGSLLVLAGLNVMSTLLYYRRCDNFGTLLMTSIWKPNLLFLIPQTLVHLFHLAWLVGSIFGFYEIPGLPQLVDSSSGYSRWEKYQLLYALWVNSGVVSFMVTGCICPSMSSFMLRIHDMKRRQLQKKTELLKYPPMVAWNTEGQMVAVYDSEGEPVGTLSNGAEVAVKGEVEAGRVPVNFAGEVRYVDSKYLVKKETVLTVEDKKKIDVLREDLEIMGSKKPLMQEIAAGLLLILLFPYIVTHVIPGFILYIWLLGPLALIGKLLINTATNPPTTLNTKYSLWYRVFFIAFVAFLLAACFQAAANFSLLTYTGQGYFSIVGKEYSLRKTSCVMCMISKREHIIGAFSFL